VAAAQATEPATTLTPATATALTAEPTLAVAEVPGRGVAEVPEMDLPTRPLAASAQLRMPAARTLPAHSST